MSETPERTDPRVNAISVLSEASVFIELVEHRAETFLGLAKDLPELLPDSVRLISTIQHTKDQLAKLQERVERRR